MNSSFEAPGPGMSAVLQADSAGASNENAATIDGFAFPQLPPEPTGATMLRASRSQPAQTQKEQAESIVNAALSEADRIREVARAEGYESGKRAATVEASERFESAFAALGEALSHAREMQVRTADEVERHAVELALQIAEKALAGALNVEPERVIEVVRGALRCLVDRERVVILVNPEDLETVRDSVGDMVRSLGGIEHCEVQEERRVERGGAVVRSDAGEIDANFCTKLDRAREVLEAELRSSASGSELRR
ncbi:MAG: FliH/SctL family protein [Thermoleophilaceae bacterium]